MGTSSSVRIIEDLDLALKVLEIVYRANGAAVEGTADRNGHIYKEVGEGEIISWGVCTRDPHLWFVHLHN